MDAKNVKREPLGSTLARVHSKILRIGTASGPYTRQIIVEALLWNSSQEAE